MSNLNNGGNIAVSAFLWIFAIFAGFGSIFSPILAAQEEKAALLTPEAFGEVTLDGTEIYSFKDAPGLENGTLRLPFASKPELDRAYIDEKVNLDLTFQETFMLGLSVDQPKAIGSVTLYFHAPGGWYSLQGRQISRAISPNRTAWFTFQLSGARQEGKPVGLDQIDMFRAAIWRGAAVDAQVRFESLKLTENELLTVIADEGKRQGDAASMYSYVKTFAAQGIALQPILASKLSKERLRNVRAVVVTVNANLDDAQIDILADYAENGGFLLLFYTQPEKLMNVLGFDKGRYYKPEADETPLAEIRFTDEYVRSFGDYFPKSLPQRSWRATLTEPLPDDRLPESLRDGANRPRVVAEWYDAQGKPTGYPAILASGRGVYWTHVLLWDGQAEKTRYWTALFGKIDPSIPRRVAAKAWKELIDVGFDETDAATDLTAYRAKSLDELLPRLAKEGWTAERIRSVLFDDGKEAAEYASFDTLMEKATAERMAAYCASQPSKSVEARLWWQHSGLGPYPGDWDRAMKELSEAGFNAVIPNMQWGGSAMYESDVLPRDAAVEKFGDQVAAAVAAGKKYGVEVHIWKVNWNCGRTSKAFIDEMTAAGRMQRSFDGEVKPWLCPSDERNRKLEADAMLEVATKYDVDGIHFDYIRYDGGEYCYCDGCRERFAAHYEKETGEALADWPESTRNNEKVREIWGQWRRDNITALVREVRRRIDIERPTCKISAAVFSGYPGCKEGIGQDWVAWIDEGLLDFVCPMDYTPSTARFDSLIKQQLEFIGGKVPLYPGIGATSTGNALSIDQVALQIDIARRNGCPGFTIFNLSENEVKKYFQPLASGPTKEKSLFSEK